MAKQDVTVELRYDSQWNDHTSDIYTRDEIRISHGATDAYSHAQPANCRLTFDNRDGRFTPRNPNSSLFGKIGRNTPIRAYRGTAHVGASNFTLTDTTDHVAPSVDAPTDEGLLLCAWAAPANDTWTLPLSMTSAASQTDTQSIHAAYEAIASSGATGTRTATFGSVEDFIAASVLVHGTGLTVEETEGDSDQSLELGAGTQAGWWVVVFGSFWSDIEGDGDRVPGAPTAENVRWIEVADTGWIFVDDADARYMQMKAWVGRITIDGAQEITYDWPGTVRSCMVAVSGVGNFDIRFAGEVSEWRPRRAIKGDVWTEVIANGITRRLGQGQSPLRSSMFRTIDADSFVLGYWPCEDGEDATEVASGRDGVDAATVSGDIEMADSAPLPGTAPLPKLNDGRIRGSTDAIAESGVQRFGYLIDVPSGGLTNNGTLAKLIIKDGFATQVEYRYLTGGHIEIRVTEPDGSLTVVDTTGTSWVSMDGLTQVLQFRLSIAVPGTPNTYAVVVERRRILADGTILPRGASSDDSRVTLIGSPQVDSIGLINQWVAGGDLGGGVVGHIIYGDGIGANVFLDDLWPYTEDGASAFLAEPAAQRLNRLCGEHGISIAVTGDELSNTAALGTQGRATLLDLLRESETADMGLLTDAQQAVGLHYRIGRSLYNQTAILTLDWSSDEVAPPLHPETDDRSVRNDVIAKRRDGASHRATLESGTLSVQDPPDGVGRYDTEVELNVALDGQLQHQAGWRLHLGTTDEARFSRVTIDLDAIPDLADEIAILRPGDRIDITNLPDHYSVDDVTLIILGWSETIASHRRMITFNTTPERPYRVPEIEGGAVLGTVGSATATLNEDLTTVETDVDIACGADGAWIHEGTDYDIIVGGERMTVTAAGAASGTFPDETQTLTVTRSLNGVTKAHSGGDAIAMAEPVYIGL